MSSCLIRDVTHNSVLHRGKAPLAGAIEMKTAGSTAGGHFV